METDQKSARNHEKTIGWYAQKLGKESKYEDKNYHIELVQNEKKVYNGSRGIPTTVAFCSSKEISF